MIVIFLHIPLQISQLPYEMTNPNYARRPFANRGEVDLYFFSLALVNKSKEYTLNSSLPLVRDKISS